MKSTSSLPTSSSPSEAEETAGADAEVSPAHLDHDGTVPGDHPRLLAYMRALLTGSVIALIVAVILFFAWNSGIKGVGRVAVAQSWKRCAPLLVLWIIGASVWPTPYYRAVGRSRLLTGVITALKLLPVAAVAACTVYACLPVLNLWRETSSTFGVRLGELLAFTMGIAACGLIVMAHIGLWAIRPVDLPAEEPHSDESSPEDLEDLWFSRPRGTGAWQRCLRALQGHPFRRVSTAALALLPAIALVAGFGIPYRMVKSTYADTPTVTQTTASAIDDAQLPGYPTSFGTQKTWVKDVDDFLDIAGSAAGPILLTKDAITGINPANGSARWQYRRAGAEFRIWSLKKDPVASGDLGLITSPNGRYVAVVATAPIIYSSMTPQRHELEGESPVTALVLDAVTGKVILEHPREAEDHEDTFQLSDSALLDGTVAYSLTDGARMWDLKDFKLEYAFSPPASTEYAGTAGHSSFILGYDNGRDSLGVISQANPSQPRKVNGTLHEQERSDIVTARGWIGVYDDRAPDGHRGNDPKRLRAHAISLDALSEAPGADTRTFDLGTTLGINAPASLATNTISVFPATTPEGRNTTNKSLDNSSIWEGLSSVGIVFNPATMAATPLNQSPHYVAAVGITATNLENGAPATKTTEGNTAVITTGDGRITIKTGDSRIIPLTEVEPGSTYYPLSSEEYNSTLEDIAVSRDDYHHISSLSTPGATLAIMNKIPTLPIASQSFRIYGFPE